jgi:acyl-CoA reductase-like NAD-dependent aldehyde dehydrogenase
MSTKANETRNGGKRASRTKPAPKTSTEEPEAVTTAETEELDEAEPEGEEQNGRAKEKEFRARTAVARIRILKRILQQLEDKMAEEMGKTSLSDYIRLLQLVREMESEVIEKEIVVQWVQEPQADDDTGE